MEEPNLLRGDHMGGDEAAPSPSATTPRLVVKLKMPTRDASPSGGPSPAGALPPQPRAEPKAEIAVWRKPDQFHDSSSSDSESDSDGEKHGGQVDAPLEPPPQSAPPPKKRSLPSAQAGTGKKQKGGAALPIMVGGRPLPPGVIPSFGRAVYDQEVVWGKLGSFPWWPCQVNLEPNEAGRRAKHSKEDTFVAFYGTGDVAWLQSNNIRPFANEYRKRAGNKNKALQKAVMEACNHILASGGEIPDS